MIDEFSHYLSGEKLYGDDFTQEEINEWFADEAEGYAGLGARDKALYSYSYHKLNQIHAFRFLKERRFEKALGIGSAYGDEFKPIIKNIQQITILDPSDAFSDVNVIWNVPCGFQKPNPSGDLAFESEHFDLITSLGVMHHIPNVSHVLSECYRCLGMKGFMLLREPITSMGDWRKPRIGLTKRERGIPLQLLDRIIKDAGFLIMRRSLCNYPVLPILANKFGIEAYNNAIITRVDALLSFAFSWNIKYHRVKFFEKLAPASVYYVLTKS
jgi:SAM-dependent methyltransferase